MAAGAKEPVFYGVVDPLHKRNNEAPFSGSANRFSCVIDRGNLAANLKLSGVIEAHRFVVKRLGGL